MLNNNFRRYSGITLVDRQNLDRIIAEQDIAANGRYSNNDFITIGNLTNTRYFLFGTVQRLSGERYSLQLSIRDSTTGVFRASFMKDGSLNQLEGSGALINEATADLLAQMGVELMEAGRRALRAGNASVVKSEAGLARGITAQAGGSQVEALFNFSQAISFDPSQIEALTRLNSLSSSISGGSISERIVNDIQARDRWIDAFKETVRFYNDHPPFEITFDPNLVQIGDTDYVKRTANLGLRIALDPSEAGFAALNALLEGLIKTGQRAKWGFSGWPLLDINPKTAGTVVFNGKSAFRFKVDVELINENNKKLGKSSITLTTGEIPFSSGNARVRSPDGISGTVLFSNVKADDLTPSLTIVIVSVNGIPSRDINASGYMKIDIGDLEGWEIAARARQFERYATEKERDAALSKVAAGTLRVGDIGPAGGYVFHDKMQYSDGWRYLEAAPADLQRAEWGIYGVDVIGTGTGIGTGKRNTELIIVALINKSETGKAAQLCRLYTMGGYNDWFLPSKDELDLMYKNLKQKRLGVFSDSYYWSSSHYNRSNAWNQRFSDGVQDIYLKNYPNSVRAVRVF